MNKSARKRPDVRRPPADVQAHENASSRDPARPVASLHPAERDQQTADGGRFSRRIDPAWPAIALIAGATFCAYAGSLRGGFVYDDWTDVLHNEQIRRLWPLSRVFGTDASGGWAPLSRPIANLSFALNYALGGLNPFWFHLTNVVIHVLAALALFGIVHRTLESPKLRGTFGRAAVPLAVVSALLWSLHPLNCQAVAYVTQRYESQMGLFFLVAIYAAIRRAEAEGTPRARALWATATVAAAFCAMGSKEVAVCLPVVILLHDRAFFTGSLNAALRRHRGMYAGLGAAWVAFAAVQASAPSRGKWAGFKLPFSSWEYALSQPGVILHYLRLACWPRPLIFDYQWPIARTTLEIVPATLFIGALGVACLYALVRRPEWGVLGAAFFMILAPTSSVMPIHDLAVEHRMYLPLCVVVVAATVGGCLALRKYAAISQGPSVPAWAGPALAGVLALVLAVATWQRNQDFRSELTIWADTAAKVPLNARAHYNLGLALAEGGNIDEAAAHYETALRIDPDHADAHNNLGLALASRGRSDAAIAHYRKALELRPDYAEAHNNLGLALAARGQADEALAQYMKALAARPDFAEAHNNLGLTLMNANRISEALAHCAQAVKLKPGYAQAYNNFGAALVADGRFEEAIKQYETAIRLQPDYAKAHNNLGRALAALGRTDEAFTHYASALSLQPNYAAAHNNLGLALVERGRVEEAIAHYRTAIHLNPEYAEAHFNLGEALRLRHKDAEAIQRPRP